LKTKKLVVGNKSDLRTKATWKEEEQLIRETMTNYGIRVMDCSAITNKGIAEVFEQLTKDIFSEASFEVYEKNMEAMENSAKKGKPGEDAKPKKTGKKPAAKKTGGILGCGGREKKEDEDDSDDEDENQGQEDETVKNLPAYGNQNKGGCTVF